MRKTKSFLKWLAFTVCLSGCQAGCPTLPVCGNGACENESGESYQSCPYDCVNENPPVEDYCDKPPSKKAVRLDLWLMQQWCTQWCWAAVITNAANYYGRTADGLGPVDECQLPSRMYDDSHLSICCSPDSCLDENCNRSATFAQMKDFLSWLGIGSVFYDRPLTENEIQVEITNGRPIIMVIKDYQDPSSFHVALITGYLPWRGKDGQTLYRVDDPWPTNVYGVPAPVGSNGTRREMLYQQLVYNTSTDQGLWHSTYARLSPREDGCSPPLNPMCACDPTSDICFNKNHPVDCGDGFCWPSGIDCDTTLFTCGSSASRCWDAEDWANCCNGKIYSCQTPNPYYCPDDNSCYSDPNACPTGACEFRGVDCGQ